jgi:hypothetical protein
LEYILILYVKEKLATNTEGDLREKKDAPDVRKKRCT